ncbi:uncharacterized protein LOC100840351 isoform X2 [Brachypodium distachyon]|uniref:uncharacterized protein LOC100840351 isoform X2 n=1 Tax=Brachypodium distachyon TaxID=15368 RepID=UPI00071DF06D|nr:uncharacterized protein LOC100840351 isoform X2 [Brachypodium distachyon]|eukprot:XP_014757313.1 uncharacterized protein LOC100840351 isoform X2 [Brachypodium distachyon]
MVDIREVSLAPEPKHAPANPDPSSVSPEVWEPLEAAALAVIGRIQPTIPSEGLRASVVDYIQRLVRCSVGCQVFPFGSVPLKTYLPDGDIDLTAFGSTYSDESLANEVRAILEAEERREDAEFEVKDVQYIHAEVKLVKCFVQNIVVDISFNQMGGLCTLCFLEQVDQRFEKNHLFKRSIILIKAWCYYESRILGAHHGLISTYALETLVLYIFHLFHESLDGPLAVLYRFLDYYSKFDWDNKGISLYGPVSLSSLPELVTEPTGTHDDSFLQREEFLKECAKMFTVPPRLNEKNTRPFYQKYFNIVDPLKQSNNLGRSVSKGNFYRIRSAFDLGARKLGKILQMPANSTVDEVNQFFKSTLKRNHSMVRPDIQDIPVNFNTIKRDNGCLPLHHHSFGDLSNQFNNISISDSNNHGSLKLEEQNSTAEHKEMKSASHLATATSIGMTNGMSTKGYYKEADGDGGITIDNLADLTGDYRTNLNNLLYSQGCQQDYLANQDYPVRQIYYPMFAPPPPPVQYQNKHSTNGHDRDNAYGYTCTNGIVPGPYPPGYFIPFYQTDDPMQAHGAATYFPNPNLCMEMPPTGRGERRKSHFPRNNYKYHRYGRGDMPTDRTHLEELRQQPPLQIYTPVVNDHGIPLPVKISSPSSHVPPDKIHGNGLSQSQDSTLEFGTLGALPLEVRSASKDQAKRRNSVPDSKPSAPLSSKSPAQNPGVVSKSDGMRLQGQ